MKIKYRLFKFYHTCVKCIRPTISVVGDLKGFVNLTSCFVRRYKDVVGVRDAQATVRYEAINAIKDHPKYVQAVCFTEFDLLVDDCDSDLFVDAGGSWWRWALRKLVEERDLEKRFECLQLIADLTKRLERLKEQHARIAYSQKPVLHNVLLSHVLDDSIDFVIKKWLLSCLAVICLAFVFVFCYRGYDYQSRWHRDVTALSSSVHVSSTQIQPHWYTQWNTLRSDLNHVWYYRMLGFLRAGSQWELLGTALLDAARELRAKPLKHLTQTRLRIMLKAADGRRLFSEVYHLLRNYLWLTRVKHLDIEEAAIAMHHAWKALAIDKESDESSIALWQYYLSHRHSPIWAPDSNLIKVARQYLHHYLHATVVYPALRDSLIKYLGYKPLASVTHWQVDAVWQADKLPAMYLQSNYKSVVHKRIKYFSRNQCMGDWVMATNRVKKSVLKNCEKKWISQLEYLYREDAKHAYVKWINSIVLKQPATLSDLQITVEHFSHKLSTLTQLLQFIHHQWPSKEFSSYFLLPKLAEYQKSLQSISASLQNLQKQGERSNAVNIYLSDVFQHVGKNSIVQATYAIDKLLHGISDPNLKASLHHVLMQPLISSVRLLATLTAERIQSAWEQEIYHAYQEHILKRFPLSIREDVPIVPNQFSAFFHPKYGLLWQWVRSLLVPYLLYKTSWVPTAWHSVSIPFSTQFLNAINDAEQLTQALFQQQRELGFSIALSFKPSDGVSLVNLQHGKHTCRFQNGPRHICHMRWVPENNNNFVELQVKSASGTRSLHFFDEWGLVRMLSRAKWQCVSSNQCELKWPQGVIATLNMPHLSMLNKVRDTAYFPLRIIQQ